jgi:hypothetical protein
MTPPDTKEDNQVPVSIPQISDDLPEEQNEEELQSYRQTIERLAELDSSEFFGNSKAAHAAVIFATFFKRSKEEVAIFCKDLSRKVYDNKIVIDELEKALARKIKVDIITQSEPNKGMIFQKIAEWKMKGLPITLRTVSVNSPIAEFPENFAVMDQKAFRFESDRKTPTAFACMNNPAMCEPLLRLFGKISGAI